MSSDIQVQVKDEPVLEDVFDAETDSENEEDIELDKLQPLDPKFASLTKFPIGCKVWYDLRKSTKPKKCLQAKGAFIKEAYIHFENRKQAYKVKSETAEYEATLYEDRLVYGANCPVTVTCPDTNEVRDGVIICPKLDKSEVDGKQKISYAIQFKQGKKFSIEFGVPAESVKCRIILKASEDDGGGSRTVAAEGNTEQESCGDTNEDVRSEESTKKDATEAHQLHGKAIGKEVEVEEGEVVETTARQANSNEIFEHGNENGSATEASTRPKKVAKTSKYEKECTCVLQIPSWLEDRRGLFLHILGVDRNGHTGKNTRHIKSVTACTVFIYRHDDASKGPMTITIRNSSDCDSDVTLAHPQKNVAKAVEMVEASIVDFLADRNTEKKMLYELAAKATGTYRLFPRGNEFVLRKYEGVKKWSCVLDYPCEWRVCQPNHGVLMQVMKQLEMEKNDCVIEAFDGNSKTPPYVLFTGLKKKDVQDLKGNFQLAYQCYLDVLKNNGRKHTPS